jgi:hypothetical protein
MKHVSTDEQTDQSESDSGQQSVSPPSIEREPTLSPTNIFSHRPSTWTVKQTLQPFPTEVNCRLQRLTQFSTGIGLLDFAMWAKTPNDIGNILGYFHIYSHLVGERLTQNLPLERLPLWKMRFPLVSQILQNEHETSVGRINCSVIHVQASINITTPIPTQVEVAIPEAIFQDCQWECVTRIYDSGNQVQEVSQNCQQTESPLSGIRRVILPFAPKFWNDFFEGLVDAQSREAKDGGSGEVLDHQQEKDANVAFKGVTIVQELFSIPHHNIDMRVRTALLLWEFTKADSNKPGKAVSRGIVLPSSNPIDTTCTTATRALSLFRSSTQEIEDLVAINADSSNQWDRPLSAHPYEDFNPGQSNDMADLYSFKHHVFTTVESSSIEASPNIFRPIVGGLDMGYPPIHHDDACVSFSNVSTATGGSIAQNLSIEDYAQGQGIGQLW